MSHHTYTTEALVLGGIDIGEASRSLILYTRDLGLVYGFAKSVREVRSKLRPAVQSLSLVLVSLVRGRDIWRVTGARALVNYYKELEDAPEKQQVLRRTAGLIRRLIRGETPGESVFIATHEAYAFLLREELTADELAIFECIVVLRLLSLLGYATQAPSWTCLKDSELSRELLRSLAGEKKTFIAEINKSLNATQL